ncbi:MAG TPA: hypothetical protein VFI31_00200 [Pirellulales bacterium]|nr:hypothetical protein [Pirellulales bacterium]
MSTLPTETSDPIGRAPVMTTVPDEPQLDKLALEFVAAADELGVSRLSEAELRDLCRKVAALSAELFSSEMNIEVRGDPEIPGELHFTFDVVATGGADEIVAKSNQWHLRLRQMIGRRAELFCLSFDVR